MHLVVPRICNNDGSHGKKVQSCAVIATHCDKCVVVSLRRREARKRRHIREPSESAGQQPVQHLTSRKDTETATRQRSALNHPL